MSIFNSFKLEQLSKPKLVQIPHYSQHYKKKPRSFYEPSHQVRNSHVRNHRLPFGITAFTNTISLRHGDKKCGRRSSVTHRLTFVPPQWLSKLILQWEVKLDRVNGGFPALGISLNPIRYNSDPRLITAIKSYDAMQLRKLIDGGLARADDYILLRRRPVLLLEARAFHHKSELGLTASRQ